MAGLRLVFLLLIAAMRLLSGVFRFLCIEMSLRDEE